MLCCCNSARSSAGRAIITLLSLSCRRLWWRRTLKIAIKAVKYFCVSIARSKSGCIENSVRQGQDAQERWNGNHRGNRREKNQPSHLLRIALPPFRVEIAVDGHRHCTLQDQHGPRRVRQAENGGH